MRYFLPIVALVAVIAGLVLVKGKQITSLMDMGKQMQKAGPPPETVATALSQQQDWESTLSSVGSITAVRGVAVSNDAPGVVSRILFESGAVVRQGQVLVELDASVERAQLATAEARMDLAKLTANRSRSLAASRTIAQSQVDNDEAQLKTSATDLTTLQAQIDRKLVRAPFSGRLGIRAINVGQYLNPGTRITELQAIDTVYVDFTLPQQRLPDVKVGMQVRVTIEGAGDFVGNGTISAVDDQVDSTTRTMQVRATVPNDKEKLRPGMFANVSVVLPARGSFVAVPATAVVHASYGDSVFIVEDKKGDGAPGKMARQQFVRLGEARGDFVAIADGVKAGQEVVSAGGFKLRNGASIVINNSVKPNAELNPRPENH